MLYCWWIWVSNKLLWKILESFSFLPLTAPSCYIKNVWEPTAGRNQNRNKGERQGRSPVSFHPTRKREAFAIFKSAIRCRSQFFHFRIHSEIPHWLTAGRFWRRDYSHNRKCQFLSAQVEVKHKRVGRSEHAKPQQNTRKGSGQGRRHLKTTNQDSAT